MTRHRKSPDFRDAHQKLPPAIKSLADKNFLLLKDDSRHPSLQFKKVGPFWSARVGAHYRALAVERDYGFLWFWIGSHAEYDQLLK